MDADAAGKLGPGELQMQFVLLMHKPANVGMYDWFPYTPVHIRIADGPDAGIIGPFAPTAKAWTSLISQGLVERESDDEFSRVRITEAGWALLAQSNVSWMENTATEYDQ